MKSLAIVAYGLSLVVLINYTCLCSDLQMGYYKGKCPDNKTDVEDIVKSSIASQYALDATTSPALIRMQFHDCFVRGCDASILLDGNKTEKNAPPNLTVRGYDVIDKAKSDVEDKCPGVVSCADIIIMAAREAVVLGGGDYYNVTLGRRDGQHSNITEAVLLLPAADISVGDSIAAFSALGIEVSDMVALIGAHTVGVAHCSSFKDRLYNFNNTGMADPTMDEALLNSLKSTCPQNSTDDNFANLDQNSLSANTVDNSFFMQIQKGKGLLGIDQEIDLDTRTNGTVQQFANSNTLYTGQLGIAMIKLGDVNVLTAPLGEIRTSCRYTNADYSAPPPPPSCNHSSTPPSNSSAPANSSTTPPNNSSPPPNNSTTPPNTSSPPPNNSTTPPNTSSPPPNNSTTPPNTSSPPANSSSTPPNNSTTPPTNSSSPPTNSSSPT
ncbi:peroxidase 28-like [Macadamia integrifolia]|uniref:peroxidase 28-like n=1 Tax=Macadamia integrifolia TaxID=60698 RepID=UPI001C4FF843|nr:peroxidase 28-like [Macadamia integrifolia]